MSRVDLFKQQFQMISTILTDAASNIPDDKAEWNPEGKGRSAKGILEHMAASNYGFSKVIAGEELNLAIDKSNRKDVALPSSTYENALKRYRKSIDAVVKSMEALPDKQLLEERTLPWGDTSNTATAMNIVSFHTMYHAGQLNYMQTLWGDDEDRL